MRLTQTKRAVARYDGLESYLRDQLGLHDTVSLDRVEDTGMHGSVSYVFDTPNGDVTCSGYSSLPPVATVKLTVSGDDIQALFGCDRDELKARHKAADDGFTHD